MDAFNETTKAEQANNYQLPPIELLNDYVPEDSAVTEEELTTKKDAIVKVLNDNNMLFCKIIATVGPTVTLFEIVPENVNIHRIKKLSKVFAESLNVPGVRIITPIWERGTIGIEVPNALPQKVSLRSLIASPQFQKSDAKLPIAIGQTVDNATYVVDLAKTHGLVIVGDEEKSAALNTILASLLYKSISSQVKFVLIDAQDKDLMLYQSLPECFFAKSLDNSDCVITDNKKIISTLESLYIENLMRFRIIEKAGCHDINSYNDKYANGQLNSAEGYKQLPYIVVVINNADELDKNDITRKIEHNIKQMINASTSGVLFILTTKYTYTRRLSYFLYGMSVRFHSREKIISKQGRLEDVCRLNGNGDALVWLLKCEEMNESRVQCAEIDNKEIERIVNFVANQSCNESAYILPNVNLTTNSINESNVLL